MKKVSMPSGRFSRRALLAGASAGLLAGVGGSRGASAFGEVPASAADAMLPPDRTAVNVLELFLFGGLSQYESFYLVDAHGSSEQSHWHLFRDEIGTTLDACGVQIASDFEPFGEDAEGNTVSLGPFAAPLRARPDLVERMRVVVAGHDAAPHEVAIPLALTGRVIGHPGQAGLGAHVQRHFEELEGSSGARPPRSYVLQPSSAIQSELVRAASATGFHPGGVRPLSLRSAAAADFLGQLQRPQVGDRAAAFDRLLARNTERYRGRIAPEGAAEATRSRAFRSYEAAVGSVAESAQLRGLLEQRLFEPIPLDACGVVRSSYETALNLRLAAHLLTAPEAAARYVCVVDGGVDPVPNAAGGYDTHSDSTPVQGVNLLSALEALTGIINAPGENDPTKLDLDRTMIVINTEFGRSPTEQGPRGRGHWPSGYPVLFIGGPTGKGGPRISGGIDANASAVVGVRPTTHRIAVLMALGIWPFAQESFNVSDASFVDVASPSSESDAAASVRDFFFGSIG